MSYGEDKKISEKDENLKLKEYMDNLHISKLKKSIY